MLLGPLKKYKCKVLVNISSRIGKRPKIIKIVVQLPNKLLKLKAKHA